MKTSREKELWDLVNNSDTDNMHGLGIGIHEQDFMYPDFKYRVYAQKGWCLDIDKEHQCEPEDIADYDDIDGLHNDGCTYSFYAWDNQDGFKEATIDEVLEFFKTESVQL